MIQLMKRRTFTQELPPELGSWQAFIRHHMQITGLKMSPLARAIGVNRSLVYRWLDGEGAQPEVKSVRAVCRALGVDAREGLIAAGHFDADELRYGAYSDIQHFSDIELLNDLLRRMHRHLPHGGGGEIRLVLSDEVLQSAGSGYEDDVVVMRPVADDGHANHHQRDGSTSS